MKILTTGLTGLIGTRVRKILEHTYDFEDMSFDTGIDITDTRAVREKISSTEAHWIFHFAAMTHVDNAEKEKHLKEHSIFWKVNVSATEEIAKLSKQCGKKLLYLSTDYVFDGIKESYDESDQPNPQGFYARTKYEGELRVMSYLNNALIIRIANPYGPLNQDRKDFVHKIIDVLNTTGTVYAPKDQIFTPTYIDDIAHALDQLVKKDVRGTFHIVGSDAMSPFDAAKSIATHYNFDVSRINPVSFDDFFKNRAPRPCRAYVKNDKIRKLGIQMSTFIEGLKKMKKEEEESDVLC